MSVPKLRPETSVSSRNAGRQASIIDAVAGKRVRDALGTREVSWLCEVSGLADSTVRDAMKRGPSRADVAVKLARALDLDIEWMLTGQTTSRNVLSATTGNAVDLVQIPRFDLRKFTDRGKGEPAEFVPLRRDWLYQRLNTTKDLWLTELPSSSHYLDLREGDLVFCSDIEKGEGPFDGWTCIWQGSATPFVASYAPISGRPGAVSPTEIVRDELHAVARVRARLFAMIDDQRMVPIR